MHGKDQRLNESPKEKTEWESEVFAPGFVHAFFDCSSQWSITVDPGISIQQVNLPADTPGTILIASGDDSVDGISVAADLTEHDLHIISGDEGPTSWKITVAPGIDICQKAGNGQQFLATGGLGTNVIGVVSAQSPLAAFLVSPAPPDVTKLPEVPQATVVKRICPEV